MNDCRKRNTSLAIAWVDYKKMAIQLHQAYDMIPHSWIIENLIFTNVADNIINFREINDGLEHQFIIKRRIFGKCKESYLPRR